MKSLVELVLEIERQWAAKYDYLADTRQFTVRLVECFGAPPSCPGNVLADLVEERELSTLRSAVTGWDEC